MRRGRMAGRAAFLVLLSAGLSGCASGPSTWKMPEFAQYFTPPPPLPNPMRVPNDDFNLVWNKTVAAVNAHFPIASENRLARTIRSDTSPTGTLIEPWTPDTVTFRDRLEATLQTMRRYAVAHLEPSPEGGYLVKVEVYKELEDLTKPASQPAGRAAYYNDFPVNRTRETVGTIPTPLGWINMGRDPNLEQKILAELRDALLL